MIESLIGYPITEAATEVKSTSSEATTNKKRPASDDVLVAATQPPKTRSRIEINEIVDLDIKKEQKEENVPAPTPTPAQVKSRLVPAQVQSKCYHEDDERVSAQTNKKSSVEQPPSSSNASVHEVASVSGEDDELKTELAVFRSLTVHICFHE